MRDEVSPASSRPLPSTIQVSAMLLPFPAHHCSSNVWHISVGFLAHCRCTKPPQNSRCPRPFLLPRHNFPLCCMGQQLRTARQESCSCRHRRQCHTDHPRASAVGRGAGCVPAHTTLGPCKVSERASGVLFYHLWYLLSGSPRFKHV